MNKLIPAFFCMILINACSDPDSESIKYTDDYTVVTKIEYGLNIKNNTGRDLKKALVLLYAPVEKSSSQKILKQNVNQTHKVNKDALGNQIISIPYKNVEPGKEDQIALQAELQMSKEPNLIRESNVAIYQNINRRISDEEQAKIDSVTQQLIAKEPADKLQEITDWVEKNLVVSKNDQLFANSGNTSAIQSVDIGQVSLVNKQGSPRGNANIMLDMAKTAGIPVRWVVGVSTQGEQRIEIEDAQLWLQFMDSGKWRLFDTSTKEEIENYSTKVLLRIFPDYIDREFINPDQLLYEAIGVEKQ